MAPPPNAAARAAASPGAIAPPVVYLLADHMDAVLARGEDLLASSWRPDRIARCAVTIGDHQDAQREVVRAIRTCELLLISRALKARERARELASQDARFAPLARIFAAATVSLHDAAREAGDTSAEQFDTGIGILAYLRGRGVVARESADLDDCGSIIVTPKFLIARRIELDVLLDLAAAFLDALELHYDVYPDQEPDTAAAGAPEQSPEATAPEIAVAAVDPVPAVAEAATPTRNAADTPTGDAAVSRSLIERLSSSQQT